jgi:hypothetical protein
MIFAFARQQAILFPSNLPKTETAVWRLQSKSSLARSFVAPARLKVVDCLKALLMHLGYL